MFFFLPYLEFSDHHAVSVRMEDLRVCRAPRMDASVSSHKLKRQMFVYLLIICAPNFGDLLGQHLSLSSCLVLSCCIEANSVPSRPRG